MLNEILKLISPFLSYGDVVTMVNACDEDLKEISRFYFNETLYLTSEDKSQIENNTIPQPLWMRMYCREMLLTTIINNEFMPPKLKVQIYNGVKKNIPSLLKLYNEYYYLVVGDSLELITDLRKIMEYLPLKIDKYEFFLNDHGEFIINYDGRCVGRNFFGETIKIIKHYGLDHIITVLKSPLIMETIALYNKEEVCMSPRKHEHRRPKVRRRIVTGNM